MQHVKLLENTPVENKSLQVKGNNRIAQRWLHISCILNGNALCKLACIILGTFCGYFIVKYGRLPFWSPVCPHRYPLNLQY